MLSVERSVAQSPRPKDQVHHDLEQWFYYDPAFLKWYRLANINCARMAYTFGLKVRRESDGQTFQKKL
jgi:hypothetical protein